MEKWPLKDLMPLTFQGCIIVQIAFYAVFMPLPNAHPINGAGGFTLKKIFFRPSLHVWVRLDDWADTFPTSLPSTSGYCLYSVVLLCDVF